MTNENGKSNWKPSYRRSYFGPILLIAIGLIFLGKNTGLITGVSWSAIWHLWPVLLIVAGLDDLFRREGIAWPILLIGAGIFLLANYFGTWIDISWTRIAQLWPILLIVAGIDLLFKGKSGWKNLVGILLAVLLIGGAVWLVGQGLEAPRNSRQIRETLSSTTEAAALDLSLDVGKLTLSGNAGEGDLITGRLAPDGVSGVLDLRGSLASYQLENIAQTFFSRVARWELELNPDIPAQLQIDNAVGELVLTLDSLNLESLQSEQGVGRIYVKLPGSSPEGILIKQGLGAIQIQVPAHTRIAVDAQDGLSKVDFPPDINLENGYYVTPGTDHTNADLLITVEQGIGLVEFQYY